ncbi:LysE family translocator [Methylopila sp. M107]|uniref:LysE family translocator n=1 Tax=Methylopila sp. M107 TaxID=1101190 RepID=UPI000375B4AC|nr:LysE family translocator [Methylopila sp. M107]
MPDFSTLIAFAAVSLGMVLTPGPNMIYLVSRSVAQGHRAGLVSLGGVILGFFVWMLLAAFGVTAMLLVVPYAYDALRLAGALYLGWLAFEALRPGGASPFTVGSFPPDSAPKLFLIGFVTNLLNPKIALLYLALLPQFIDPERGEVLTQTLALGGTQIVVATVGDAMFVFAAGAISGFLARRPFWATAQRWLMGCVFGALAVRMALDSRR